MSIKIIQIDDGGASEFDSFDDWVKNTRHSSHPVGIGMQSSMLRIIARMPSGTVAHFGGGWVLKDVKEVEIKEGVEIE